MASIFMKPDPKDKSIRRWSAKVKVGDAWKTVSLRLLAVPGTKREAQQRANDLQNEIRAGHISDSTRAWLGDEAWQRLSMLVGRAAADIPEGSPNGWRAAYLAYLKACDAQDTRVIVQGKTKAEEKTKITRKYKLKKFVDWAEDQGLPFMQAPFTETIRSYIETRKESGIQPGTLWAGEYTLLCCWGEWMAEKRICETINRKRVREAMPPKPTPQVVVPTWEADLAALRFFRGLVSSSELNPLFDSGPSWKRKRSERSAWLLVLLVRGLGCRPSEATALSWETVDLAHSRIRFLKSKNDRNRTVPIVFQWVLDGLRQEWERLKCPKSGPVCRKWDNQVFEHDTATANLIQRVCERAKMPVYHLKRAQKAHIAHLIRLGFPPHVVAHWTDHTLSVQEKHYFEGDGYLPPEDGWDYAEFGTLSEYGQKVLSHVGAYSKSLSLE